MTTVPFPGPQNTEPSEQALAWAAERRDTIAATWLSLAPATRPEWQAFALLFGVPCGNEPGQAGPTPTGGGI